MRYTPQIVTKPMGINAELTKIALAINDTLSRVPDTPNFMDTDLDMNSNRILNLPAPTTPTEPLRYQDLLDGIDLNISTENFVDSLKALPTSNIQDGAVYHITGFYAGGSTGGGHVVFRATGSKSSHNGVTVYAPEALQAWAGTQADIATLLNWTGVGSGVWVRIMNGFVTPEMAGAASDLISDDTDSVQAAINVSDIVIGMGKYRLTQRGTISIGSLGVKPYCVFIDSKKTIDFTGASFSCPVSDADTTNAFLIYRANSSRFTGGLFSGIGANSASSRILFTGAGVIAFESYDVEISGISTSDMRGGAYLANCDDSKIINCFGKRDTVALHNGSFFTIYQSRNCIVEGCSAWGGSHDGDMFLFGEGEYNKIINCKSWNALFGDASLSFVWDINQGFGADSQQNYSTVEGCFVYGAYYGVDAKTNSTYVKLINNTAVSCKVGLSSRRGEGDGPNCTVEISGNEIRPVLGNGNNNPIGGAIVHAIRASATSSLKIAGNTLGVSYQDGVCSFDGITITIADADQIKAENSPGALVYGNNFIFHQAFTSFNAYSTGRLFRADGSNLTTSGSVHYPIQILGNQFSPYALTSNSIITVSNFGSLDVSDNDFGYIGSNCQDLISITDVLTVQIQDNVFNSHKTAANITMPAPADISSGSLMLGCIVSGNTFGKGRDYNSPLIIVDGDGGLIVNNNQWWRQSKAASNQEGLMLNVINQTTENLMFIGNSINTAAPNSGYYSLNGTLNKTGANIVVSNVKM